MLLADRLMQAQESVEEARILRRERMGNKNVLAKLYHALMYCLFALLEIRNIGSLTHADIIDRFEKEFVRKGAFDDELLNAVRRAYDLTHECDCDHMPVPSDEDINLTLLAVDEFIRSTEHFLQAKNERKL